MGNLKLTIKELIHHLTENFKEKAETSFRRTALKGIVSTVNEMADKTNED